jgi:hypothetical protein
MYGTPQSHLYPSKSFYSNFNPKLRPVPEISPANDRHAAGRDQDTINCLYERTRQEHWPEDARRRAGIRTDAPEPSKQMPETLSTIHDKFGKKPHAFAFSFDKLKYPNLFPRADAATVTPPSGVTVDSLNSFEADQRRLVDQLVNKRHASYPGPGSNGNSKSTSSPATQDQSGKVVFESEDTLDKNWTCYREPAVMGSPSKKQKFSEPPDAHHRAKASPSVLRQETLNANDDHYPHRFSFKIDDSTFATSKPQPNGFTSPSTENINTKFTPEEWAGAFKAGGYFMPEQKASGIPPRGRAQSGTRSRGRSPIKIRPVDPKVIQPRVEEETLIESPGGTKFAPDEWAQSFKPQTFMPPPPAMPPRTTSGRKGRTPSIRTTLGGNAAVVDDSENTSDEKPLFTGRKPQPSPVVTSPSPDPMEVDSTPPGESNENQAPKTPSAKTVPFNATSPSKRAAAPSHSPIDSALKVEFDDLKLRDLISHLNLPVAPVPPKIPVSPTPEYTRPLKSDYEAYLKDFKAYMCDWDLFNNQFMFHILARKKHNDEMGAMRWEDDAGLEKYRMGLREDKLVLGHWSTTQENHQLVMKEYAILKERMKDRSERERPRKKTH